MADHLPDRKAGRRLRSSRGGRRRSGLIDEGFAAPGVAEEAAGRRRKRVARGRIVAASVIGMGLIGGAIAVTFLSGDDDVPTPPEVQPTSDDGAAVVVAVTDTDGLATSIVLVAAQSGGSARIMLFPPALVTVVPGFGERPISDALRLGGVELLELTVTNLLGVRVDSRIALDAEALAGALGAPLDLDLIEAFVVPEGDEERVLVAAGQQTVEAELATRLLVDPGTDDQLTWLVRQGAVWRGIAGLVASDASVLSRFVASAEGDPALAEQAFGNAAQSEGLLVTAVPVQRISVGDGETYAFDADSPADVVDGAFPFLSLAPEPRIKVEVLSGTDVIGSTRPVSARLIREGYRVLLTDNAANDDFATTEIVAQSRNVQEAAVAVQRLLGTGEVFLNVDQPSGVVDLTIIVGADLAGG